MAWGVAGEGTRGWGSRLEHSRDSSAGNAPGWGWGQRGDSGVTIPRVTNPGSRSFFHEVFNSHSGPRPRPAPPPRGGDSVPKGHPRPQPEVDTR